jgi:hypothetical protein
MALFGNLLRRHQADDCAAVSERPEPPSAAVSQVLTEAGFPPAVLHVDRLPDWGFQAVSIRGDYPGTVYVIWHFGEEGPSSVSRQPDPLGDCAAALAATGYEVEFSTRDPAGHLVTWLRGES